MLLFQNHKIDIPKTIKSPSVEKYHNLLAIFCIAC